MSQTRTAVLWLSLLLLLMTWVFQFRTTLPQITLTTSLEKEKDLRVHQLSVRVFNHEGQQTHALESPLLEHSTEDETHRLQSPQIHITEANQPAWDIRADEAQIQGSMKEIILSHHVRLKHAPFKSYAEGRIETEELHYFPAEAYAMTEMPIRWVQLQNTLFSKGMKAYLHKNQVQLFKVEARYESSL